MRQFETAPKEARIARANLRVSGVARQRQFAIRANEDAVSSVMSMEAAIHPRQRLLATRFLGARSVLGLA